MDETSMEVNRQPEPMETHVENSMPKIRMVYADGDGEGEGLSAIVLDINFTNGQTVLLPLTGKAYDPAFIELFESGRISRPKTDGARIYWIDGPSLSCAVIVKTVDAQTRSKTGVNELLRD